MHAICLLPLRTHGFHPSQEVSVARGSRPDEEKGLPASGHLSTLDTDKQVSPCLPPLAHLSMTIEVHVYVCGKSIVFHTATSLMCRHGGTSPCLSDTAPNSGGARGEGQVRSLCHGGISRTEMPGGSQGSRDSDPIREGYKIPTKPMN